MRERIIIVGGGVSGLLLGSLIGDGVRIFEEHSAIGFPEHCTGIISLDVLHRMKLSKRLVEASFNRFILYFPSGYRIILTGSPLAVKVDRPGVERELYYKAIDRGAKISLKSKVQELLASGKIVVNGIPYEGELIILAEGYKQYFSRKLGLVRRSVSLPALQARIVGEINTSDVEVYFSNLTPGYFSWFVPISDSEAVVGLAGKRNLKQKLYILLRVLERTGRISLPQTRYFYGGLILRGPPGKLSTGNIVAIGDSIGMVKPLTGGGLYPISIAGTILSEVINKYIEGEMTLSMLKKEYETRLNYFISRLKTIQRILDLIDYRVEEFLKIIARGMNKLGFKTLIDEVDYDDHLRDIITLLNPKNKGKLLASIITGLIK